MKARVYFLTIVVLAVVALRLAFGWFPPPDYKLVVVLGLLCFLVEWFAIQMPSGGSASLSISIAYATILLGGPLTAALASLSMAVTRGDIKARKPPLRMAFNAAQLVITALISGGVFSVLGGVPLLHAEGAPSSAVAWLGPAVAAIPVQVGVNIGLVAVAMVLMHGISFREIWVDGFRPYLAGLAAPFLLGLVFAQVVAVGGYWAMLLLVAPFLVAKQTFRVYQDQADAYRDSLRSLISALEAKDTYTRGHSERVARYARGMAEQLGLGQEQVQAIEQAALLHDIGKIAISTEILRKPASLSASEYEQIRGHPGLAAETLAGIEFLEGIIPMISGHHERLDGRGYPKGLRGDEITLGARILAVADCFDAMTSDRPYRRALQVAEAVSNLHEAAGSQLDQECVSAFVTWAARGRLLDTAAVMES